MRDYINFFKIPFIFVGILAVITLVVTIANGGSEEVVIMERTNTECTTTERVFDYADVLTDSEEDSLRERIAIKETETQSDIVIVTLNESLVEYAAQYEDVIGAVPISQCVMVYADNFYEENRFGYDRPVGDGTLLLDNWYREEDGKIHSWMLTSGRVIEAFSESDIDYVLNYSLEVVEDSPYEAYCRYVDTYADYYNIYYGDLEIPFIFTAGFALLVAGIFFLVNIIGKKGKSTVNQATYVVGGRPTLRWKEDRFIRKSVSKVKINTDSNSSGGGRHTSAGGSSFGGGGHSR